jgi:diguanylate cyclase (GGDEF)-like protein
MRHSGDPAVDEEGLEQPGGQWPAPAFDAELIALGDELNEALVDRGPGLRFSPALEAVFERETRAIRERLLAARGLFAVVLYDLFLVTDTVMTPDVLGEAAIVRLGLFTPFALFFLWRLRRGVSSRVRDALQLGVSLVAVGGFIYIFTRSGHPNAAYYHGGLILVLTVTNFLVPLRFRHALALSVTVIWIYAVTLRFDERLPLQVEATNLLLIGTTAGVTLFGSYRLQREQRLTFLLNLRDRVRAAELATDNRRLGRLATRDTLTALANRRGLDTHLQGVLRRPRGGALSVLMVDIDHFKEYNDRYGHQQGDDCLQQVARALAGVPIRTGDLVARYGGEEFVVVLPGTDEEAAVAMAERLRETVAALAIPHEASPVAPVVTVSVGVATGSRDSADGAPLIEAADAALYRAKAAGRNRVA